MSEKPVKDYDKFVVRLPEGMRDAISDLAKRNGRSMNSQIVQILEDTLTAERLLDGINFDEDHRSNGARAINIKELEEIMEKVVSKALVGFTGAPIDKKR